MRRFDLFAATMALAGLAIAVPGMAAAAGTAQAGVGGAAGGNAICRVRVSRSATAGVFDVTREVLSNGKCVCRVNTGPRSQGGTANQALASIMSRKTCADAPLRAANAAASGGGGGLGSTAVIVGAAAAVGGLAAALGSGGTSSP